MAREGKGDLVDYGKTVQEKKDIKKPAIPGFEELADNEAINERQYVKEDEQETKHEHDKSTEQFLEQYEKKITKEDTHTRQTWLIKNETIKRLDKLAKGKKKGFKTELVNQALELFLGKIEK